MGTLVFVCPTTGLESLPAWKWILTPLRTCQAYCPTFAVRTVPNPINSVTSLPACLKACAGRTRRL